jgi:AsmA protein
MNKIFRWLAILLATLVLLSVLLSVVLLVLIDPNDYRDEISAAVTDATGRTFVIEGDLSLKTFPCCGIGLGAVELGNPPGFPDSGFARVENAAVDIQVWPLLTRQELLIGTIELAGLDLRLLSRADGGNNWTFTPVEDAPAAAAQGEDSGAALSDLDIAGIEISDGRLSFRDEAAKQNLQLSDIALATGAIRSGEPFDVEASLKGEDLVSGMSALLAWSTQATIHADTLTADLADSQVDIDVTGGDLGAESVQLSTRIRSVLGLGGDQVQVTELVTTLQAKGAADATIDAEVELTAASAEVVAMESVNISTIATSLELTGSDLPGGRLAASSTLQSVTGLGTPRAELRGLVADVKTANINLKLEGEGALVNNEPVISARLKVAPFSPQKLLEELGSSPIVTSDPKALQSFALQGLLKFNGDIAGLENIEATLDDSKISGWLRADSLEKQKFRASIEIDALDLDRYLAPTDADGEVSGGAGAGSGNDESLELPVEELRAVDLDSQLKVGKLKVLDARLTNFSAKLTAQNGVLKIGLANAKLYDGTYFGNLQLNVQGQKPKLSVDQMLKDIQLGNLLTDVSEVKNLAGRGEVRITGDATGDTVNELLENLVGQTTLNLQKGQYTGVDIWYEIRKARAQLVNEALPMAPANPVTDITQFSGTAKFAGGNLNNDDFSAEIPFMRMLGGGSINLVQSTIDYKLQAKVVGTPVFGDGKPMTDLKGLTLPITIRGSLDSPSVGVDLKSLASSLAQGKLGDLLKKKLDIPDPADTSPEAQEQQEEKSSSDQLKDDLKRGVFDLLNK